MAQKNQLSLITKGFCNARLKLYLAKTGELVPDNFMVCEREVFNPLELPMVHNAPNGKANQKLREEIEAEAERFIDEALEMAGKTRSYFAGVDLVTPAIKMVEAECLRKAQITKAETNLERSRRRARTRCRDYVLGNYELDMMVTLTISADEVDRYNYDDVVKRLSQWLSNRVKRNGLKYVLVPELHKDGAIHFHGFVNSDAVKLSKTKYKRSYNGENFIYALNPTRKGRLIYNIADWSIGYTTAVRIGKSDDDRNAVATYILKYLAKQNEKVGGRWYLHSNNLKLPYEIYMCYNYLDVPCEAVSPIPGINIKVITRKTNSTFLGKLNFRDIYDIGIHNKKAICADTPQDGI
jgi:hypothetical protein